MESLIQLILRLAEKILLAAPKSAWRFLLCPLKKLAFPVRDLKSGIRQSRMRYYQVRFSYRNDTQVEALQEVTANGVVTGYYDVTGKRYLPDEPQGCSVIAGGAFQHPEWGRIDWADVFSGSLKTGCWAITEK